MTELEKMIIQLKKTKRDNFYFLRRRVDKGNGKRTLGWICKRDDTTKTIEGIDFYKINAMKNQLKENGEINEEN